MSDSSAPMALRAKRRYWGWDFIVRSFNSDYELMLETVHKGRVSKDMEVAAARACGRLVTVTRVSDMQEIERG